MVGADWGDNLSLESDYFDNMNECAIKLIKKRESICLRSAADEIREYRETLTEQKEQPYRDRSVEENLALFEEMRRG